MNRGACSDCSSPRRGLRIPCGFQSLNLWLTMVRQLPHPATGRVEDEMWIDFAIFLVACQALSFGIIRIVQATGLI